MIVDEKKAGEELKKRAEKVTDEDIEKVLRKREEIERKFSAHGTLGCFISDIKLLFALIQDYFKGQYREVPFWSIAAIVAALLYVLSPFDLIPDFIPIIGYLDDAAVVAFCLKMVEQDLLKYKEWKKNQV
jgi:uncharacterized membrane protein YkvA (DUF1232 family)